MKTLIFLLFCGFLIQGCAIKSKKNFASAENIPLTETAESKNIVEYLKSKGLYKEPGTEAKASQEKIEITKTTKEPIENYITKNSTINVKAIEVVAKQPSKENNAEILNKRVPQETSTSTKTSEENKVTEVMIPFNKTIISSNVDVLKPINVEVEVVPDELSIVSEQVVAKKSPKKKTKGIAPIKEITLIAKDKPKENTTMKPNAEKIKKNPIVAGLDEKNEKLAKLIKMINGATSINKTKQKLGNSDRILSNVAHVRKINSSDELIEHLMFKKTIENIELDMDIVELLTVYEVAIEQEINISYASKILFKTIRKELNKEPNIDAEAVINDLYEPQLENINKMKSVLINNRRRT